ncbi:MAG: glycosyltransferase [Candidatus Omnitrophica bacterium]|nr:glycosyltransferase [Candidatus Omnitrophota bacterium]
MINSPRIQSFCFTWPGTQNNHAGMTYFAKCLKKELGYPFSLYCNSPKVQSRINLTKYYARIVAPFTDCFFFMEYLSPIGVSNQEELALNLRLKGIKKPMVGLVHLPEGLLLKTWRMKYIQQALDQLDHILVYGSSLTDFLKRIGYGHKVHETFHYVDSDFYHPPLNRDNSQFKVIVIGSILRDMQLLKVIVGQCSDITFQICSGKLNLNPIFENINNVELYQYIPEEELLKLLQQSQASLSVMEDTIGSNSIVGGLACGVPQIVSDVGSIRDYCSEKNTIFCKEPHDYIKAIRLLSQNKELCFQMGESARKRALELNLPSSINWFRDFFRKVINKD